ncbi:MAG TPA: hypothetical protein VGJ01_04775 [Pseudolabrys sp.]
MIGKKMNYHNNSSDLRVVPGRKEVTLKKRFRPLSWLILVFSYVMKPALDYRLIVLDGSGNAGSNQKSSMDSASARGPYPSALINLFALGLVGAVFGVAGLVLGALIADAPLRLASSIVLAVAATTVAITLIRGQDLKGRT